MNNCKICKQSIDTCTIFCKDCYEVNWRLKHYLYHPEGRKHALELLNLNWKDPKIDKLPSEYEPFVALVYSTIKTVKNGKPLDIKELRVTFGYIINMVNDTLPNKHLLFLDFYVNRSYLGLNEIIRFIELPKIPKSLLMLNPIFKKFIIMEK